MLRESEGEIYLLSREPYLRVWTAARNAVDDDD